jgi:hypothetical protein
MTRFAIAGALCAVLLPTASQACGGFFCSSTPVDQEAERIIFVQEDPQTVRSIVEIQYQGDPESFAWVVPVPAVPELTTFYASAFNALDLATQPQFVLPPECQQFFGDAAAGGAPEADGGENAPPPGEVVVHDRKIVGPFDTATIESEDPRALIEWLRTNGFRIPEAMEPFITLYTNERMKFVAMKLLPGEGTDAIKPISMRYTSASPAVPLRLTSVAALLEMGVKIWVLGAERYGPQNVPSVEIADNELRFDLWTYQSNYAQLVARKVDALRGPGFVTELATGTEDLAAQIRDGFVPEWAEDEVREGQKALAELLQAYPYLTRLYTRVSPEEMFVDPVFGPVPNGGDVSNVHQLDVSAVDHCDGGGFGPGDPNGPAAGGAEDAEAVAAADERACDFAACGAAGRCAVVGSAGTSEQYLGCACAEGALGRVVVDATAPMGVRVACGDARMNFTRPEVIAPDEVFADPCESFSCGENGECVSLNGFPSCRCAQGFALVGKPIFEPETGAMRVQASCESPRTPIPDSFYLETTLPEPFLPYPGRTSPLTVPGDPTSPQGTPTAAGDDDDGCSTTGARPTPAGLLFLPVALAPLALRRRRRG